MLNHSLSPMAPNDSVERRTNMFMTVNRSAMEQYKLSLENCSNTTANIILEEIWKEHQDKVDDQSPTGVDNCRGPIDDLIQKHMIRYSKKWKSNLRSFSGSPAVETAQCHNCIAVEDSLDQLQAFVTISPSSTYSSMESNDIKKINEPVHTVNAKPHSEISKHDHAIYSEPCGSSAFEQRNIFSAQTTNVFSYQSITTESNVTNANIDVQKVKSVFKTAREELLSSNPAAKRSLGTARKTQSKFVSPLMTVSKEETEQESEVSDERLKHIDPKMVALIQSEIIDNGSPIKWEDIAGLQTAKSVIQEAVVWPLLRPDIFTGLRRPPKGVLLFGPPGTGKTLIGKCVASQCRATFFNISASSLTSKWIGDGEKMVRALFAVARCHQPAVVFVDEIDSLLMQRSDAEHEATRRIKTEFLVQFDGAGTGEEDLILVIGATNRPQELDEAARRRFVKRLYIPLPDNDARKQIVSNLMRTERHELGASELEEVGALSDGYSGADVRSLCSEAAMGPIRSVPLSQIPNVQSHQVRAVSIHDFRSALQRVRPSVSPGDLAQYAKWNSTYGFGH